MRLYKHSVLSIESGAGTSDSWGFSLQYCKYDRSIAVMILHWYAYVSVQIQKKDKDTE